MQIKPEHLEKILLKAFNAGYCYGIDASCETFAEWYENQQKKILALGKPEPLAYNKQYFKLLKVWM